MSPSRRTIRELMIWTAVIALGLGALTIRAQLKAQPAREAARRTRELNEARQQAAAARAQAAVNPSPIAPAPEARP